MKGFVIVLIICLPVCHGGMFRNSPNLCLLSLCRNGATCRMKGSFFRCTCPPGFSGTRCDTDLNTVTDAVTTRGMLPVPTTDIVDGNSSHTTDASASTTRSTASTSENILNLCLLGLNLCSNGATCRMEGAFVRCTCPPGFSGTSCDIDLNADSDATSTIGVFPEVTTDFDDSSSSSSTMDASASTTRSTATTSESYNRDCLVGLPLCREGAYCIDAHTATCSPGWVGPGCCYNCPDDCTGAGVCSYGITENNTYAAQCACAPHYTYIAELGCVESCKSNPHQDFCLNNTVAVTISSTIDPVTAEPRYTSKDCLIGLPLCKEGAYCIDAYTASCSPGWVGPGCCYNCPDDCTVTGVCGYALTRNGTFAARCTCPSYYTYSEEHGCVSD